MKHQEHIFAVPADIIPKADETNLVPFTVEGGDIVIAQRAGLEVNTNYRQILPYILVECKGKLFTYQRTKGIGEDRLLGKHSIGLGGHIDLSDCIFHPDTGVLDWQQTYALGALREILEEIRPSITAKGVGELMHQSWGSYHANSDGRWIPTDIRIAHWENPDYSAVLTESARAMSHKIAAEGDVESVHLGCPRLISVDSEDWTTAEEELVFDGFMEPEDILNEFDCERWTEILLVDYLRCREENGGELSITDWFDKR